MKYLYDMPGRFFNNIVRYDSLPSEYGGYRALHVENNKVLYLKIIAINRIIQLTLIRILE